MYRFSTLVILTAIILLSCKEALNENLEPEFGLEIQTVSSNVDLRACYDEFRPAEWENIAPNGCSICGSFSAAPGETITLYGVAYFGGEVTSFEDLNYNIEWSVLEGEATLLPDEKDPRVVQVTFPESFDLVSIMLTNTFIDEESDSEFVISEPIYIRNANRDIQLNDPGQAGQVFYDKGNYTDDWRYMEFTTTTLLSPSIRLDQVWGLQNQLIGTTVSTFGAGWSNTLKINNFVQDMIDASDKLEETASSFSALTALTESRNGFSDWHLPSLEEAKILVENRANNNENPGTAPQFLIWTSSEVDADHAFAVDLNSGEVSVEPKNESLRTIAIRYF